MVEQKKVLAGRRALVTGANGGLGRAFALALARAGADVAVTDIQPGVRDVGAEVAALGRRAPAYVIDLGDERAVETLVASTVSDLSGLDIVINNAAVTRSSSARKDSFEKGLDDFDTLMAVNLRGAFLVGRLAVPHLLARGGGDIVNITTDHIHTCGYPEVAEHSDGSPCPWATAPRRAPFGGGGDFDVYDASKWGLKGLTMGWARALYRQRIRVNSFGMGATDTSMLRDMLGGAEPVGAIDPAEVARVLVDLLAEGPDGRTGDSVMLWPGHALRLREPSLDGRVLAASLPPRTDPVRSDPAPGT